MSAKRPARGSVFLVEDEVMIRMMVADMLEELGFSVAAEAGEIDEAIRLAETAYFDLAILDDDPDFCNYLEDALKDDGLYFIRAFGHPDELFAACPKIGG